MAMKGYSRFSKLQHYRNFSIKLFSVISWALVGLGHTSLQISSQCILQPSLLGIFFSPWKPTIFKPFPTTISKISILCYKLMSNSNNSTWPLLIRLYSHIPTGIVMHWQNKFYIERLFVITKPVFLGYFNGSSAHHSRPTFILYFCQAYALQKSINLAPTIAEEVQSRSMTFYPFIVNFCSIWRMLSIRL